MRNHVMLLFILMLAGSVGYGQSGPASPFFLSGRSQHFKDLMPTHRVSVVADSGRWSDVFSVPGVIDGPVYALATDGTDLYVGGSFTTAGTAVANNVARWDGRQWHSVGQGAENGVNTMVQTLAFHDGKLFVGGGITRAGSTPVNSVAYWDGTAWNALGSDSTNGVRVITVFAEGDTIIHGGYVYGLYGDGGVMYVGGQFHLAGGGKAVGVAGWNIATRTWERFNGGMAPGIPGLWAWAFSFARSGPDLYVAGSFDTAGSVAARNLARWDGSAFHDVGGGVNNWVRDIAVSASGAVTVAGNFDTAGTMVAPGIARWSGSAWEPVGPGNLSADPQGGSFVKSFAVLDDNIYIAGHVVLTDHDDPLTVAEWNGSVWSPMSGLAHGSGKFTAGLHKILRVGSRIYGGGEFNVAGEGAANHVAEWDPVARAWKPLDDGNTHLGVSGGSVMAFASSGSEVYAGGMFDLVGGLKVNNIARWDGRSWHSIGEGQDAGVTGIVYTIIAEGNDVFVGGYFGWAGTTQAYHVARWDGSRWHPLGIGVGGVPGAMVTSLAKLGDHVYVGGFFSLVGDLVNGNTPANSIARFNLLTEQWEPVDFGFEIAYQFPGLVYALRFDGDLLYAGGRFNYAGDRPAHNLAVLKSDRWGLVGHEQDDGVYGDVYTLEMLGGDLIVGGSFTRPGEGRTAGLARWDGYRWSDISGGVGPGSDRFAYVTTVREHNKHLYVGGYFGEAGDAPAASIAVWDGWSWDNLDGGMNSAVSELLVHDGILFAGGWFSTAGGIPSSSIAMRPLVATGIAEDGKALPADFQLFQNYPNPFNPSTRIEYRVATSGRVRLTVYDATGRLVEVLVDREMIAGDHVVTWQASHVPSGIYFLRMHAANSVQTRKMVLVR